MDVLVARQPIFDRHGQVFSYELLFRSGVGDYLERPGAGPEGLSSEAGGELDADRGSLKVIESSFFLFGIEAMTGGKKALARCPTPRIAAVCWTAPATRSMTSRSPSAA